MRAGFAESCLFGILLVSITCPNVQGMTDVYKGDSTSDLGSVAWFEGALSGDKYKVITPHPLGLPGAYSFIKVRAQLSRNINLTVHIHSSSATDKLWAYAMRDSNKAGDNAGPLKTEISWDYTSNYEYNFTIVPNSNILKIPLWTGEAFYIQSDGDLSGTTITQEAEPSQDRALLEVVAGADGMIVGGSTSDGVPGLAIDSVPGYPNLWGTKFVVPFIPAKLYHGGLMVKYVTWYPWQQVQVVKPDGGRHDFSYNGHGAGELILTKNEPVLIESDDIMYPYLLPFSGNLPPSAAQILDVRSGAYWYQLDLNGFLSQNRDFVLWVEVIIENQYYDNSLYYYNINSEDYALFTNLNVQEVHRITDYTCAIATIDTQSLYQLFTSPLIPFSVILFSKCTDNTCATIASLEPGQSNHMDMSKYPGDPETTDPNAKPTRPGLLSTGLASTVLPSIASTNRITSTIPTTTRSAVTTKPTPSPPTTRPAVQLPPSPYFEECPCLQISNLGKLYPYEGTYLKVVHNAGLGGDYKPEVRHDVDSTLERRFAVNGDFITFNERPIWTHQDCDSSVFYHSKEVKYWLLGQTIGKSSGPVLNYGRSNIPVSSELSSPWRLYDGSWYDYDQAVSRCSCQDMDNDVVYLDTTLPNAVEGYYFIYGQLHGHNVYKHHSDALFLYYYKDALGYNSDKNDPTFCNHQTDEYWAVGKYIGGNGPLAYIRDAVFEVDKIGESGEAHWRIFSGDLLQRDPYFTDADAKLSVFTSAAEQ